MGIRAEAVPDLVRNMLAWLVCCLLLIMMVVGRGSARSEDSRRGYACLVEQVSGVVWWRQPLSSGDTTCRRLEAGMMLRPGCQIKTGRTSRALLTLVDGTTVSIGHDTYLVIGPSGLESIESGSGDLAVPQIRMFIGRIWLEVTKRFQLGRGFEVETPSSTVAVRGTAFDVEVDEEGTTYVWVDSGEVVVENAGGSLVVQPGQSGKAKKGLPRRQLNLPGKGRPNGRRGPDSLGSLRMRGKPGGPNHPHSDDDWAAGQRRGQQETGPDAAWTEEKGGEEAIEGRWGEAMKVVDGKNYAGSEIAEDHIAQALERCALFEGMDPEAMESLVREASLKDVPRGGILFLQGDESYDVYVVASGRIRLYRMSPDGAEKNPLLCTEITKSSVIWRP